MKTYTIQSRDGRDVEVSIETTLTHLGKVCGFRGHVEYDNGTKQTTISGEFSIIEELPIEFYDWETGKETAMLDEIDFGPAIDKHLERKALF